VYLAESVGEREREEQRERDRAMERDTEVLSERAESGEDV